MRPEKAKSNPGAPSRLETRGPRHRRVDFVAVGHLAVDLPDGEKRLGGAAAYASLTASRLGLATAVVTAVGETFDLFAPLDAVEVHARREGQSTSFENVYTGDGRRQRLLGRARPIGLEDLAAIEDRLEPDAAVLYCPIARELDLPLVRLAPRGIAGVAPQGLFRVWDDEGHIEPSDWPGAGEALAGVDVVSLSREDVPSLQDLVPALSHRLLVVTEGREGARLYWQARVFHLRAFPTSVADPTGAGDVFVGALLVALREGQSPLEAARFACCAASFAVEKRGVAGVPPSRAAVDQRVREYRRLFPLHEQEA